MRPPDLCTSPAAGQPHRFRSAHEHSHREAERYGIAPGSVKQEPAQPGANRPPEPRADLPKLQDGAVMFAVKQVKD
jgi:hypothetical protein